MIVAAAIKIIENVISSECRVALETQLSSDRDINLNHASCSHTDNLFARALPVDNNSIDQRKNVQGPAEQLRNNKRLREADKVPKDLRVKGEDSDTEITRARLYTRRYQKRKEKGGVVAGTAVSYTHELLESREGDQQSLQK